MKRALILGATSAMGKAIADTLAENHYSLFLAARDLDELKRVQSDLQVRHRGEVFIGQVDAADFDSHPDFLEKALDQLGGLDLAVYAIGLLGEQPEGSHEREKALQLIAVNFTAAVSLLAPIANRLEEQGEGAIVGISSVAGDRARQSKYVYDAAKGGFSLYLQGLRNRLHHRGVRVYTVKPGFVDTSMTYGLPGLFLVAKPDQIARSIWKMLQKPSGIYYMPWFWRWILLIIKSIPESIFKKLKM